MRVADEHNPGTTGVDNAFDGTEEFPNPDIDTRRRRQPYRRRSNQWIVLGGQARGWSDRRPSNSAVSVERTAVAVFPKFRRVPSGNPDSPTPTTTTSWHGTLTPSIRTDRSDSKRLAMTETDVTITYRTRPTTTNHLRFVTIISRSLPSMPTAHFGEGFVACSAANYPQAGHSERQRDGARDHPAGHGGGSVGVGLQVAEQVNQTVNNYESE